MNFCERFDRKMRDSGGDAASAFLAGLQSESRKGKVEVRTLFEGIAEELRGAAPSVSRKETAFAIWYGPWLSEDEWLAVGECLGLDWQWATWRWLESLILPSPSTRSKALTKEVFDRLNSLRRRAGLDAFDLDHPYVVSALLVAPGFGPDRGDSREAEDFESLLAPYGLSLAQFIGMIHDPDVGVFTENRSFEEDRVENWCRKEVEELRSEYCWNAVCRQLAHTQLLRELEEHGLAESPAFSPDALVDWLIGYDAINEDLSRPADLAWLLRFYATIAPSEIDWSKVHEAAGEFCEKLGEPARSQPVFRGLTLEQLRTAEIELAE